MMVERLFEVYNSEKLGTIIGLYSNGSVLIGLGYDNKNKLKLKVEDRNKKKVVFELKSADKTGLDVTKIAGFTGVEDSSLINPPQKIFSDLIGKAIASVSQKHQIEFDKNNVIFQEIRNEINKNLSPSADLPVKKTIFDDMPKALLLIENKGVQKNIYRINLPENIFDTSKRIVINVIREFSLNNLSGADLSIINSPSSMINDIKMYNGNLWFTCSAGYSSSVFCVNWNKKLILGRFYTRGSMPRGIYLRQDTVSVLDSRRREISEFKTSADGSGSFTRVEKLDPKKFINPYGFVEFNDKSIILNKVLIKPQQMERR